MAAMANFLVKDDSGSEATLIPITDTPDPFWRANAAGVPMDGQIRVWFKEEVLKDGTYKRTVKVEVPILETLGTAGTSAGYVAPQKVAYVETHIHTSYSSSRATLADRANSLKYSLGVLQGASSTTATGVLSNTAAADSFKNSTLPGPYFLTSGVKPS